jgi:hypothetical protein
VFLGSRVVRAEAPHQLIALARIIQPGQAFVPCSVCKSPIDLAATALDGRICAICVLSLLGYSEN